MVTNLDTIKTITAVDATKQATKIYQVSSSKMSEKEGTWSYNESITLRL